MNKEAQKLIAAKFFQKTLDKISFNSVDDIEYDLCKIIDKYPELFISSKSLYLLCILSFVELYISCLMSECLSKGVKSLERNPVLDIFNKERNVLLDKYSYYSTQRLKSYEKFKDYLQKCLLKENFTVVNIYHVFPCQDVSSYNMMDELEKIASGNIVNLNELKNTVKRLKYYILITEFAYVFDYEAITTPLYRLSKINFYYTCFTWLKKFYKIDKSDKTVSLIKGCAKIVRGMASDSSDPRRQEVYEMVSGISSNFMSMDLTIDELKETIPDDIELKLLHLNKFDDSTVNKSLVKLAFNDCCDEQVIACKNIAGEASSIMKLEFSIEEDVELSCYLNNVPPPKQNDDEKFNLKIEFD